MLFQITMGSLLMMGTVAVVGLNAWVLEAVVKVLETVLGNKHLRLTHSRPRLRVTLGIMTMSLWALLAISGQVWLWAVTLMHLGGFDDLETAVYFTLATFTTLGYGDVLLPKGLRILGALAAVNGMLNIGVLTAVMIDAIHQLRLKYGLEHH